LNASASDSTNAVQDSAEVLALYEEVARQGNSVRDLKAAKAAKVVTPHFHLFRVNTSARMVVTMVT